MRWPFRLVWFLAFHLVLWWTLVSALNSTGRQASFLCLVVGFVVGVGVVLQASARLPALYHGLALFIFLPGMLFLAPSLTSAYQGLFMPRQQATVVSASTHRVSNLYSALPGTHVSSYTDLRVRLSGSNSHALLVPGRGVATGSSVSLHVDPLGLVTPQDEAGGTPAVLVLAFVVLGVLAEIELISSLVRPDGGSFIAESGRSS